jgi:hypothetical protein
MANILAILSIAVAAIYATQMFNSSSPSTQPHSQKGGRRRKYKTKKEFNRLFDDVINEIHFFNEQDYSPTLIEEGLFDMFQGFFGKSSEGILQHFKERIAEFVLGIIGVSPDSWVGSIISVSIGNLNLSDVSQLTNCSFLTKFLTTSCKDSVSCVFKTKLGTITA